MSILFSMFFQPAFSSKRTVKTLVNGDLSIFGKALYKAHCQDCGEDFEVEIDIRRIGIKTPMSIEECRKQLG